MQLCKMWGKSGHRGDAEPSASNLGTRHKKAETGSKRPRCRERIDPGHAWVDDEK